MGCAVGMDVGGTNIKTGVVSGPGKVIEQREEPTETGNKDRLVEQITTIVENFEKKCVISGLGLGVAGLVDYGSGVVVMSPHLPLDEFPLRDRLREELGIPVRMDNDVNVCAVGEHYFGAARGVANFIYLTIGTGIGGAIFIGGDLYRGTSGFAGELGHMMIDVRGPRCYCGSGKGCLEALASGSALERLAGRPGEEVTAAADAGDAAAVKALGAIARCLGVGIANIINIFDPELVVIGGKVARAGPLILEPAMEVAENRAFAFSSRKVKIKTSPLGERAGILGAATMVLRDKI